MWKAFKWVSVNGYVNGYEFLNGYECTKIAVQSENNDHEKNGESFHTKTKKLSNGYKFLRLFLFYTSQKWFSFCNAHKR